MTQPDLTALHARAQLLDQNDVLSRFKQEFCFPQKHGKDAVYLVGNSLGLMPKRTREYVNRELDAWASLGVDGHFTTAANCKTPGAVVPFEPWLSYHQLFAERGAALVGALPSEVVAMGSLTANLNHLMVSFYRPSGNKKKIVIEQTAFPSDRWAVQAQAAFHGHGLDAVHELAPRTGEDTLRTEDIIAYVDANHDSIALLMMGGVNYYTGQRYDIKAITAAAKKHDIVVGFDLAHAAGNVPCDLHDAGVDFAAWCTYKYLNSGPGSTAMAFVHERHHRAFDLPRLVGWWSSDEKTRFLMQPTITLQPGAAGWQQSNAPILSMASLHASLSLFAEATLPLLRQKSIALTGLLFDVIDTVNARHPGVLKTITPRTEHDRGAQVSLRLLQDPERFLQLLEARGVMADFRRPDVIRIAPVPMYCSFQDVATFGQILSDAISAG